MTLIDYKDHFFTNSRIEIMFKKVLIFTILISFLSGCATGPDGYMKRSANNKIFDRKGFKGGKRRPLYNKKYIAQAKKNVINGDYEDEEFYETENVSQENIEMYKAMIEEDLARQQGRRHKSRINARNRAYPSIVDANSKIDPSLHTVNLELREEIDQIKAMLNDARKELASYKCPTAQEIESNNAKKPDEETKPKKTPDQTIPKDIPSDNIDSIVTEPVRSI